jgi:hypothetical protein
VRACVCVWTTDIPVFDFGEFQNSQAEIPAYEVTVPS